MRGRQRISTSRLGEFAWTRRRTHCDLTKPEYDVSRSTASLPRKRRCREQGEEPEMNRLLFAVAALAVATVPASAQQIDGRVIALSCMNCHGPGGKSPGDIPSIAGKSEDYIKTAMIDFRDGKRTG